MEENNTIGNDNSLNQEEKSVETSSYENSADSSPIEESPKKKLPIIIGVIVALILVAVAAVVFVFINPLLHGKVSTNRSIDAKYDADGIAYIPLMNGNVFKIDDNVFKSKISPNREYIVTLTLDKELYYTGAVQGEKIHISDNGYSIAEVNDVGIIYSDYDGDYHRYLYADGSDVNIGRIYGYHYLSSNDNFNVAFVVDSEVYLLAGNSQDKEKIGNVTNNCRILYVSDDGKTVYWNDYKDNEETVFVYTNDDKSKVGTFETDSKDLNTFIQYNESKSFAVVYNYKSDTLFVVNNGEEPLKIKLGNTLESGTIYTASCILTDDSSDKFEGIYTLVDGSDGKNLYFIDEKGEREKVLSNINQYVIYENCLYYIDEDNNLKIADLNGAALSEERKISSDVQVLGPGSINNGYLYFAKDYNSNNKTGTLYGYKKGDEPFKIASDVSCLYWDYKGFVLSYLYGGTSTDGKSIYFYKDCADIADLKGSYGVLYKFTYGDSEPIKIASDVILGTLSSFYESGLINNTSFTYLKYSSFKNNKVIGDWYYNNGTDSSKMAEDVIE